VADSEATLELALEQIDDLKYAAWVG